MTNEWPPLTYVHAKGKFVSVHGMKAYGGGGITPLILKIGTTGEIVRSIQHRPPPPVATKIEDWAGPRAGMDALKKK
jgi:hypothetical protein